MTKNGKKCTAEIFFKYIFFNQTLQFRIPKPPQRTSKLQEKPLALKRDFCHESGSETQASRKEIHKQRRRRNGDVVIKHLNTNQLENKVVMVKGMAAKSNDDF
jgi:hypothetical protein